MFRVCSILLNFFLIYAFRDWCRNAWRFRAQHLSKLDCCWSLFLSHFCTFFINFGRITESLCRQHKKSQAYCPRMARNCPTVGYGRPIPLTFHQLLRIFLFLFNKSFSFSLLVIEGLTCWRFSLISFLTTPTQSTLFWVFLASFLSG